MLDGLDEVNVCVGYQDEAGNAMPVPCDADGWAKVKPVYEVLPGWHETTFGAKDLDELPQAARDYINRLEALIGAPVDIVSTGPDRVETIVLRHPFEQA